MRSQKIITNSEIDVGAGLWRMLHEVFLFFQEVFGAMSSWCWQQHTRTITRHEQDKRREQRKAS